MLRGSIVVITASLSIIFLKRKLFRHHWTGVVIIVGGILIVAFANLDKGPKPDPEEKIRFLRMFFGSWAERLGTDDTETSVLGVIMVICAQFFTGAHFVI